VPTECDAIAAAHELWMQAWMAEPALIEEDIEPVRLEGDSRTYDVYGLLHDSSLRLKGAGALGRLAKELEDWYQPPHQLALVEEHLFYCPCGAVLDDVEYALARYAAMRSDYAAQVKSSGQATRNVCYRRFLDTMEEIFRTTKTFLRIGAVSCSDLPQEEKNMHAVRYHNAITLPQPLGMEATKVYIRALVAVFGLRNPKISYLYVGLTPERSAYMARRVIQEVRRERPKEMRLYCGYAHRSELLYFLQNPESIEAYLTLD